MKRIETMAIVLLAGLAFLVPARLFGEEGEPAQPPEPEPREGRERRERKDRRNRQEKGLRQLMKELGLDEEQARQFKEIVKESQKSIHETVKKATEEREAKIREILTEEQAAKFEELSRRGPRGRGPTGMQPGGRQGSGRMAGPAGDLMRVMLRELDLSPEQREKVVEILRDAQGRMGELMREVREGGGDPEAMREKLQALQNDLMEKIEPILSPDQLEKFEEVRKKVGKKIRGGRDQRGGRNPGGRGQGDPEAMLKRRLKMIRDDLRVEIPEVWAVLGEKIENILRAEMDYRMKLRDQTKKLREMMKGELEEELLESGLAGLRELKKKHQESLKSMRSDLRELLNLQEEAKLVMHGVLD